MTTLNQGRIEQFFLDAIHECSDLDVERKVMPLSMQIDEASVENPDAYPITLKLLHLEDVNEEVDAPRPRDGMHRSNLTASDTDHIISEALRTGAPTDTVRAKYLIGCDG